MEQVKAEKAEKVKTKVRFTSLDVAAMVAQLQSLIGLRVSNIYDLNPTTYIFKIARSEEKYQLLVENGVRFHITEQKPDKKTIPSGFTMKFRRFLRSKRIESIRQVGVERVVVISFGTEAFSNHIILELYSQGNIILTDQNYKILQCIRSHEFNDKAKTAVGEVYPFEHAANIYLQNIDISPPALDKIIQAPVAAVVQQVQTGKKKAKQQNKGGFKVKDAVFKMIPCLFPQVIQHILASKGVDPDAKIEGQQGRAKALQAAKIAFDFLKNFLGKKQAGFLYSKGEDYFQFSPYANCKLQKWNFSKLPSFGQAVAEYFSKYKHSANEQQEAFQQLAWRKYEQIRKDQEQRVKKLIEEQESFGGKAQLIERNVGQVQAVLKIISTMQANGYSWEAMERMVAESRKTGDPLANMIYSFNAPKRQVTVLLTDNQGEDAHLCALTPVDLLVDYNAYTNATMYYEGRKKQQQKEQRTREASDQVLKLAEKDALKQIQKKKNELLIKAVPTRKQLWFQKFYWFVTSDGWLVISGRDSHQNQLLVKRYMKAGDLYMHSDYGGAASTIIKGPPKSGIPPIGTLEQAAIFTVCRSKAWDTKIISSAWWVYHDQVSKSAPTGQFLPTGSFMIRGKRNFVHPNRMEMGMTLLYRLDNESMIRHIEHKKNLRQEAEANEEPKLQRPPSQSIENEQYAIIDLDAQARLAKQKKKQRAAKGPKDQNKNPKLPQIQKKESITKQAAVDSSEEEVDNQDEQEENKGKKPIKTQVKKNDKKNDKKQLEQKDQQKHKNRNKKKLKKLQKYLDEQDEDQRQVIMKMLGAKQMKHMKQEEQQVEEQVRKKNKDKKNKDKKRGIEKYINLNQNGQRYEIDTNKVLFLKEKKQEQSSEQQPNQIKQEPILENEESKVADLKLQQVQNKQQVQETEEGVQQQQGQQPKPEQQEQVVDSQEEEEVVEKIEEKQEQQVDEKIIDSQLYELGRLAGKVSPNDKWDALVPMCAPYPTLKDNNFKVKLVPGGLKKGKAARNIQSYYLTTELNENQKAFVRALPEQQLINAIIGNVKLAGAGLLKIDQKSKADKKVKRKEQDKKVKKDD